jgi:hypothetical protein
MTDLPAQVDAARAELDEREDGQLIRGRRQGLLRALGDGDRGRGRRALLARETVEHVLPVWYAERPGDSDPARVLGLIDGALSATVDETEVRRAAGALWGHVDNLIATTGPEPPLHVGYAASRALLSALFDEPLDPADADPERTDYGRDPRRLDSAFLASTAAAGGAPWIPDSEAARRREFWQWWLQRVRVAGGG